MLMLIGLCMLMWAYSMLIHMIRTELVYMRLGSWAMLFMKGILSCNATVQQPVALPSYNVRLMTGHPPSNSWLAIGQLSWVAAQGEDEVETALSCARLHELSYHMIV